MKVATLPGRRNADNAWSARLRRIDSPQALAVNRMGSQPACQVAGTPWRWSWQDVGPPRATEGLWCETPQARFWLALDDWSLLEPALVTGLAALGGAERLAVHEHAAQALLATLSRWTGGPVQCTALAGPDSTAEGVVLGFVLAHADSGAFVRGWWVGPADTLRPAPAAPLAATELRSLAMLPVTLPVELGRCVLAWRELNSLRCGDVLRLEMPPRGGQPVRVRLPLAPGVAAKALVCRVNQSTLTVETVVSTTFDTAEPAPDSSELALSDLGQLPCTLVFELGRVSLSMAELARVRSGHSFALSVRPSAATVRIVANGRTIGLGEMVAVGDELAVVVQAIETPGDVQPA
jgi:type III secretion system YscQ/HrcQ family protein